MSSILHLFYHVNRLLLAQFGEDDFFVFDVECGDIIFIFVFVVS